MSEAERFARAREIIVGALSGPGAPISHVSNEAFARLGSAIAAALPEDACIPAKHIHLRPVALAGWRSGELVNGVSRFAVVRCYACGGKWLEDDTIRKTDKPESC